MSLSHWAGLVVLHRRRADTAMAASRQAEQHRAELGRALERAAAAFDHGEDERARQRQALYVAAAERAMTVSQILQLSDRVQAMALEAEQQRSLLRQSAQDHQAAAEAARQAAIAHMDLRRRVEKSEAVERRLASEHEHRQELGLEVDLEDLAPISHAYAMRSGDHAG